VDLLHPISQKIVVENLSKFCVQSNQSTTDFEGPPASIKLVDLEGTCRIFSDSDYLVILIPICIPGKDYLLKSIFLYNKTGYLKTVKWAFHPLIEILQLSE
jgi:hypothetical protein